MTVLAVPRSMARSPTPCLDHQPAMPFRLRREGGLDGQGTPLLRCPGELKRRDAGRILFAGSDRRLDRLALMAEGNRALDVTRQPEADEPVLVGRDLLVDQHVTVLRGDRHVELLLDELPLARREVVV